jgi:hypothetical protein
MKKVILVMVLFLASSVYAQQSTEGYKGIVWGTSMKDSGLIEKNFEVLKNEEGDKEGELKLGGTLTDDVIGFILGVPYQRNAETGLAFPVEDSLPTEFKSIYDSEENVTYIFCKDLYAMCLSELTGKSLSKYKAAITAKYPLVDTKVFVAASTDSTGWKYNIDKFQKKGTEVYLIQYIGTSNGQTGTALYLLYGSQNIMGEIRADVKKTIKDLKKQSKQEENGQTSKDMKNIE